MRGSSCGSPFGRGAACTRDTGSVASEESTTPDLAELARKAIDTVSRGDLDTALSLFAPDAVLESRNLGVFEGVAAIRGFFEDWLASYDEYAGLIEEDRSLGNGVTLTVALSTGRPVGSSGQVPFRNAAVGVWVEDKIVRLTLYANIDEARAAAER